MPPVGGAPTADGSVALSADGRQRAASGPAPTKAWKCGTCTFENAAGARKCSMCFDDCADGTEVDGDGGGDDKAKLDVVGETPGTDTVVSTPVSAAAPLSASQASTAASDGAGAPAAGSGSMPAGPPLLRPLSSMGASGASFLSSGELGASGDSIDMAGTLVEDVWNVLAAAEAHVDADRFSKALEQFTAALRSCGAFRRATSRSVAAGIASVQARAYAGLCWMYLRWAADLQHSGDQPGAATKVRNALSVAETARARVLLDGVGQTAEPACRDLASSPAAPGGDDGELPEDDEAFMTRLASLPQLADDTIFVFYGPQARPASVGAGWVVHGRTNNVRLFAVSPCASDSVASTPEPLHRARSGGTASAVAGVSTDSAVLPESVAAAANNHIAMLLGSDGEASPVRRRSHGSSSPHAAGLDPAFGALLADFDDGKDAGLEAVRTAPADGSGATESALRDVGVRAAESSDAHALFSRLVEPAVQRIHEVLEDASLTSGSPNVVIVPNQWWVGLPWTLLLAMNDQLWQGLGGVRIVPSVSHLCRTLPTEHSVLPPAAVAFVASAKQCAEEANAVCAGLSRFDAGGSAVEVAARDSGVDAAGPILRGRHGTADVDTVHLAYSDCRPAIGFVQPDGKSISTDTVAAAASDNIGRRNGPAVPPPRIVTLSAARGVGVVAPDGEAERACLEATLWCAGCRAVVSPVWSPRKVSDTLLFARVHYEIAGLRAGVDGGEAPPDAGQLVACATMRAQRWLARCSPEWYLRFICELEDSLEETYDAEPDCLFHLRKEVSRLKCHGDERPFEHPKYWAHLVVFG